MEQFYPAPTTHWNLENARTASPAGKLFPINLEPQMNIDEH
jgi:hypothetical protein